MKKFFEIAIAALLIFSLNIAAFAGFTSMPKAEEPEKTETVTVAVTLRNDYTPVSALETFEKYEVKDEKTEEIKGRIFTLDFKITNDTKDIIYAREVLEGFDVSVAESGTEKVVNCWTKAKDKGFAEDLTKIAINPGETKSLSFKIYAITDKNVVITISYEEITANVEKEAVFTLIVVPAATETTAAIPTTEETTEETTTASTEMAPEITSAATPTKIENSTIAHKEPAISETEIPNTGSSKMIGATTALGLAAIAALVIRKKFEY